MHTALSLEKFDQLKKQAMFGLKNIADRIQTNYHAEFKYDAGVVSSLINQSIRDGESVSHIIDESVLPDIAAVILLNVASQQQIRIVSMVSNKPDQQLHYHIS